MSPYMRELRGLVGTRLVLIPAVAAVVHDDAGRVLLVRTTSGHWALPAGAIDPGETPQQAVIREGREETGLELRVLRVIDVLGGPGFRVTYDNGDQIEATVAVFACDIVGGALHCDGVETTEARWVPPEQAAAMLTAPFPAAVLTGSPVTG